MSTLSSHKFDRWSHPDHAAEPDSAAPVSATVDPLVQFVAALLPTAVQPASSLAAATPPSGPASTHFCAAAAAAASRPTTTSSRRASSCSSSSSSSSLLSGLTCWPYLCLYDPRRFLYGVIAAPALPPFPFADMSAATTQRRRRSVPSTPRVISPSPTPSEQQQDLLEKQQEGVDGAAYYAPVTRSARRRLTTPQPVEEEDDNNNSRSKNHDAKHASKEKRVTRGGQGGATKDTKGDDSGSSSSSSAELRRARTRSRSPIVARKIGELTASRGAAKSKSKSKSSLKASSGDGAASATTTSTAASVANGKATAAAAAAEAGGVRVPTTNGHLRPPPLAGVPIAGAGGWSWRDFSRSPSPLGLIPIHRHWRSFVHKHEVPRKLLHVSIGFLVIWLYASGTQTRAVCPYLMGALLPIASVDLLRHRYAAVNRLYVRLLGALMRESEFAGYNGVIFYLLGAWAVLYALPKDVGVVSVLLLSWCDTAASTFGRLYGRYTPRIRRGKTLAGSAAAFLVGVATAAWFWGWLAPHVGPMPGDEQFLFRGTLHLPARAVAWLGLDNNSGATTTTTAQTSISGALALGVVSVWSGLVAAASEVVDVFGWDDNLTIPVLSGAGIWAFLKVFG
ncbi:phosphatidate cytidylyltransferase [Niveomyces insectorum RCEF 264]|uniref:Phosphatidate cytidylyltransferase n=1 Tax=Niveomyces insectorum RCEF 264 TaxID=1081102 RepID=A0A167QB00_9HYPO|nr:phosphatidate cytidylyltransferase [Niveomyces insectorum RCEF 264]